MIETMTPADIKAWRKSLKLTQFEAADALGISRRQLQNYEKDEWPVPLTVRLAMAALEAGIADPDQPESPSSAAADGP